MQQEALQRSSAHELAASLWRSGSRPPAAGAPWACCRAAWPPGTGRPRLSASLHRARA